VVAIRAGRNDAREGRSVFFWTLVLDRTQRHFLIKEGWKDLSKFFIVACVLDLAYQLFVLGWIYPGQMLIVAAKLAIAPYLVVRGLANRVACRIEASQPDKSKESVEMDQDHPAGAVQPPDQVQLALERTYLAYERTLMAWVRTATGLITFGFTLYKFFFYLVEREPAKHAEQLIGPRTYGLAMMGLGVFTLAAATWQYRQQIKRLRAHYAAPHSLSLVLAVFIAVLGTLGFFAAVLRE
jgi:putative membrane protein